MTLQIETVRADFPADTNLIVGQSHFIKTVEDLYEAVVSTVPQAKFGLAFNESSGPCLIRSEEMIRPFAKPPFAMRKHWAPDMSSFWY